MTDWNRALQADYIDFTTDDNDVKLIWDAAVKLAPEGDEFGSAIDGVNWVDVDDPYGYGWRTNGFWTESGDKVWWSRLSPTGWEGNFLQRQFQYDDADVFIYWSDTCRILTDTTSAIELVLWKDEDNCVRIIFLPRDQYGSIDENHILVTERVNGVSTAHYNVDIGAQADLWMRIKRVRGSGTQTFTFYYATADPAATPANWIEAWSGVIYDATHFNENHQLYPGPVASNVIANTPKTFHPDVNYYRQWLADIAAQRFWPDSPQCNIIDSAAGAVEHVADMGMGRIFVGSGFICTKLEPGISSVKFKAGYGDVPNRISATWISGGTWMTEMELNTQVAAGVLNGHRYLFLKAQFNSDNTVQPALTNIIISGQSVSPVIITIKRQIIVPIVDRKLVIQTSVNKQVTILKKPKRQIQFQIPIN